MITTIIIAITSVISYIAFNNRNIANQYIFAPPAINRGEWYRFLTYGLLHADFTHLFFNMFTLYLFGSDIERVCKATLGEVNGSVCYLLLYLSALFISIFPTYLQYRNDNYYHGLGASGAVSAVVFAYVLINPMSFMGILFIPIWLPAFLFGIIFILISVYLDKNHPGGINHSAHIAGGVYGIVFMIVAFMLLKNTNLVNNFVEQIHINSIRDIVRFGY